MEGLKHVESLAAIFLDLLSQWHANVQGKLLEGTHFSSLFNGTSDLTKFTYVRSARIKGSCKYGVRHEGHEGLKYCGKILGKIGLFQVVVLARPPNVIHQGSELPDIVVLRCTPLFNILIHIL